MGGGGERRRGERQLGGGDAWRGSWGEETPGEVVGGGDAWRGSWGRRRLKR